MIRNRVQIQSRTTPSTVMVYGAPILALVLTTVTAYVLLSFGEIDAKLVLYSLFIEPLSDFFTLTELLVKAAPLMMIALGLSLGFRSGVWNIGAEGQYVMGALSGGGVALFFYEVEGLWLLPLMSLTAILAGMGYAGIAAFLKTRYRVNEILVTLMLNYVAILFLSAMVHGPLRNPEGFNFPESRLFHDSATLPIIWEGTRVHLGFLFALASMGVIWFLLAYNLLGFKIKVSAVPLAARFAGFDEKRNIWFCLLFSGGMAGLSGLFEVAGPIGQLVPHIPVGYGFTAIIVAFLSRLHPVGILFSSLLISLTYIGGENVQIALNLPSAITHVFQGLLLFYFLACEIFIHNRIVLKRKTV